VKPKAAVLLAEIPEDKSAPTPLHCDVEVLPHAAYGWLAVYHFFHEGKDGHASYIMGEAASMTPEEAMEKASAPGSTFLQQARQAFLQAFHTEVLH
jgi:hypothetical protein